jgi:SRSO17 transposase
MDRLDHPDARKLLADADLSADAVRSWAGRLEAFAARYRPLFHRQEQRRHALTVLRGKRTALQRKTTEPLAAQAGQKRRPLQRFVGAGGWHATALLAELRRPAAAALADPDGACVLGGSAFPKKGDDSCGVARPGCGRLGKVENCQVGAFLGYAGRRGKALLGARRYLPKAWAADPGRRAQAHVPADVPFQELWRLALGLLDEAADAFPAAWVTGDDAFGRGTELRAEPRRRGRRYLLDAPCDPLVRDPTERREPARPGGEPRRPEFERVDGWVARQPAGRWRKVRVRDGAKGPLELLVLALWFLELERLRLGGENAGGDGAAGAAGVHGVTARAGRPGRADRGSSQPRAAAY